MVVQNVQLKEGHGLHARPASVLSQEAAKYQASITLVSGSKRVDCKSIIGLLSLGALPGSILSLEVDGSDEQAALQAIDALFAANFNE